MNNQKYWENRIAWNMHGLMEDAEKKAEEIRRIYMKASTWLSLEEQDIFDKYMTKHGLSEEEAMRLMNTMLNKSSIEELVRKLSEASSDEKKELRKVLEAPAYRARIERLQELQSQIDLVMQNIYKLEKEISTECYINIAEEAYYRSIFELQKRTGLAFSFSHVDSKQIERVLSMDWAGRNYSGRIWQNTDALAQTLKEEMVLGLITGKTERDMSEKIAFRFSRGAMQARRLVRTESAFVAGELTSIAYEECNIKKYRYLATLDLKTSKICRELDGQVFLLSERKQGKNYPPMHPWCRSTTIGTVDEDTLREMKRAARDPVTGKTIYIPANMTYKQWYQKYVAGNSEAVNKERALNNRWSDRDQYKKYRAIYGSKVPKTFAGFQEMKYNKTEEWEKLKTGKQEHINEMEFSQMEELKGSLGNKEVRSWYKSKDEKIPDLLDKSKPLKEQAQQAFELRNMYRSQARELMADKVAREELEKNHRNLTFEEIVERKEKKYGLTGDAVYQDIIRSSTTTNKTYDRLSGLENGR